MTTDHILHRLTEGTILEGPHWTEPVKVLTAKARGSRIEVQAVGTHTRRLWTKLLKPEEFDRAITVTSAGALAALDGNPTHFRLAAEAHRIRLAFQYDPHFAVSVSQVDPLPHQMDAVYTHLLTQPRIRFLIADDPGAGKTIMAGLLIKELKFRGLIERTLIITPANLTDQWRRELHDKFGETFSVVNRATINAAYGRNVWEDTPQCITSVDFVARQDDILHLLRDVHFDLCIVDEAHKMAAYRDGTRVNKTQRYELGEFLRDHTDHYLFLTATPHKGDPDNFALLLQLLDQDLYANGHILAEASAQNENRLMVRRLKEDMKKFDGSPCFPPRHVQTLPYKLSPQELTLYNAVTGYVQQNFQRAEAAENRNVGLALTVLQRRLASSVAAIRSSLERRHKRLKDLQKLGKLRQEFDALPEDFDDLTEAERWQFEDDLAMNASLCSNGMLILVFAHKSTAAWETLVQSLLKAGLEVTSSWPLHTEMTGGMVKVGKAVLASSIFIICRRRSLEAKDGLWDDVRQELKIVAQERLDFFWNQGIRGADFFISAIGPALSVFGRYERVTKLSGEEVTVGQFLDEVRSLVTNYALTKILHTTHTEAIDPESRFYVVWQWSYGDTKVSADESFKLSQALGMHTEEMWDRTGVLEKSGENVQAVPIAKRMRVKNLGEPTADGTPASLIDVLHRLCALREQGDTQSMAQFLGQSGHANNPTLWLVAQAISEILPDGDKEKQLVQGLLNQREGLEEATRQRALF